MWRWRERETKINKNHDFPHKALPGSRIPVPTYVNFTSKSGIKYLWVISSNPQGLAGCHVDRKLSAMQIYRERRGRNAVQMRSSTWTWTARPWVPVYSFRDTVNPWTLHEILFLSQKFIFSLVSFTCLSPYDMSLPATFFFEIWGCFGIGEYAVQWPELHCRQPGLEDWTDFDRDGL
jgi:hypothetical protein